MTPPTGQRDDARDVLGNAYRGAAMEHVDLLERMSDGFIALDREWRIVYMNRAARGMGEAPGDDVIGRSHWEQWPNTVGTEVERQYRRAMETQRAAHFEHRYVLPDREFWHRIDAYPDANGLSVFFRDVTEEKRAADLGGVVGTVSVRLVSTLDARAIMNEVATLTLPAFGQWSCLYLVEPDAGVTMVASAALDEGQRSILRHVVKQLPVRPFDARLPWNRALQTGQPVLMARVDQAFYDALGTHELRDFVAALAPRSLLSVPLMARGRTIGGVTFGTAAGHRRHDERDLAAATDLALPVGLALDTARLYEEQRRARFLAEEAQHRAEAANLSKVDFLRAMSHEMRTPLNAIGGYVQLLRMGARGELPEIVQRDLQRLERNHLHVTRLINDMMHFAKLEAGRVQFVPERVDIARILGSLEDFIDPQDASAHHLTVRPCGDEVRVWADADKVTQILVNLVSNAIKHTPPGTLIEVFCADAPRPDGQVTLVVHDEGPGIPADHLGAIFEPFVQVGRSLSHPVEGLGLGLAIARDLARGMGGDLTVASTVGQGATFSLTLPRG